MNSKAQEFRNVLEVEVTQRPKISHGFDMQRMPEIVIIDDDKSVMERLKKRLPSVSIRMEDIDDIVRRISRERSGIYKGIDLIFIDTFYRDEESGIYAIEFFDQYRSMNEKAMKETEGKYRVLISIDEMNYRLEQSTSQDYYVLNENTKLRALLGKIQRSPHIEWGENKGSKIDKMVEEVERWAEKNKIYLYKSSEMTVEEWIEYIRDIVRKTNNLVSELQVQEVPEEERERLNSIITKLNDEINSTNKVLGEDTIGENGQPAIRTIEEAIEYMENYANKVSAYQKGLMRMGIDTRNRKIMELAHHYVSVLEDASNDIYRAERNLNKKDRTDKKGSEH